MRSSARFRAHQACWCATNHSPRNRMLANSHEGRRTSLPPKQMLCSRWQFEAGKSARIPFPDSFPIVPSCRQPAGTHAVHLTSRFGTRMRSSNKCDLSSDTRRLKALQHLCPACRRLRRGFDVVVHAEEIRRVVLVLQDNEAVVIRPVSFTRNGRSLVGNIISVGTRNQKRLHSTPALSRPPECFFRNRKDSPS